MRPMYGWEKNARGRTQQIKIILSYEYALRFEICQEDSIAGAKKLPARCIADETKHVIGCIRQGDIW